MTDYRELIRLLAGAGVEFIIIGGAAATAHGSARLTEDLDIVYRRETDNVKRLVQTLAPLQPYLRGAQPGLPFSLDEETVWSGLNFTLTTALGFLDLFGEITLGGNYEELLPYSVRLPLFGVEIQLISLQRLIDVKRSAGRPKDFEVIAELEAILEQSNE